MGDFVGEMEDPVDRGCDFIDRIDSVDCVDGVNTVSKVNSVISVNLVIITLADKFPSQLPGKRPVRQRLLQPLQRGELVFLGLGEEVELTNLRNPPTKLYKSLILWVMGSESCRIPPSERGHGEQGMGSCRAHHDLMLGTG